MAKLDSEHYEPLLKALIILMNYNQEILITHYFSNAKLLSTQFSTLF